MKRNVPYFSFIIKQFLLALILFFATATSFSQNIDFGKSYINVSKGLNGGTVEPGDTLEIRASFVVRSGTYDSCRYTDVIPAGTSYINGTIRVLTNEGKIYKQFTDTYGDDPGWRSGSNITIHLGYDPTNRPATAFRRGRVVNTHKPSFYGGTCIMIASFRVRVTAVLGSNISTGGGSMTYKRGAAAIQTFNFPQNTVRVYTNYGICSNTIGTNAIGTEFNGSFGNGKPRNRGTSANVPPGYTYAHFAGSAPQDYYYGIANNTSTDNYTTLNTWPYPDPSSPTHRVFGVWDIIGDHTGASDPIAGNPAADTVANSNAGYMLIINAAYRIDSAFQQTISGLCPNTYYEISCWMRNICSKCGCDSNGKGASNSSGPPYYIPSGPGDSSGVQPNLTFEVDGIDYYTTGNLVYTGKWIKKGFTFLTGPAQTSFTLKFFNNAPGGGGNDWALDDISVSTCSPNMKYSPSNNPTVCDSNIIMLSDTVRSYFNNYTYYKWQRSTDGGSTWTDVTGPLGPSAPYWNGTDWEYVTSYTVPPAQTRIANSGDMYRVIVATTLTNLSDVNCRFTDQGNIITLNIIPCGLPLATQFLSFTGKIFNQKATLEWITTGEDEAVFFDIERSYDGIHFTNTATVNGYHDNTTTHTYNFTDPEIIAGKLYYRISMKNNLQQRNYSKTIQLSTAASNSLSFISVTNPFISELLLDVSSNQAANAIVQLTDIFGRVISNKSFNLYTGVNRLVFENLEPLPASVYIIKLYAGGTILQKKVVKQSY